MSRRVLVAGGAGFVGSQVAARFVAAGDRVTVLDGFLPGTGAAEENLAPVRDRLDLVRARVEEAPGLAELCASAEVVIDAMAFTSHHVALREPLRDLDLNAASHLHLIRALPKGARVIYLASRGQYGRAAGPFITEDTPMVPEDIQGIHKLAGESYHRVYAPRNGFSAVSLRFPNCFGPHQQTGAGDIGLIGGLIRDLLAGGAPEIYAGRRRQIVYAPDVAEVVFRLAADPPAGFTALNHAGRSLPIEELARRLAALTGGRFVVREIPKEIAALDVGEAQLVEDRLRARIGAVPETDLDAALEATVDHFRRTRA